MPVVEGQVFLQIALVFGLIGLFGLVLRWTFRRDASPPSLRSTEDSHPHALHAEPEAARPDGVTGGAPEEARRDPRSETSPTSPPAGPVGHAHEADRAPGHAQVSRGADEDGARDDRAKRTSQRKSKAKQPAAKSDRSSGTAPPGGSATGGSPAPGTNPAAQPRRTGGPTPLAGSRTPGTSGAREDYGLLAVAAEAVSEDEATKVRRTLTAAGIRNTNATAADGRHLVLVFGDELIRARRVAGGSHGASGGS